MNHSHCCYEQMERASAQHHRLAQPQSPRHKVIPIHHQAPEPPQRQPFNIQLRSAAAFLCTEQTQEPLQSLGLAAL